MSIINKIREIDGYMPSPDESESAIRWRQLEREKLEAAKAAMTKLMDLTNTCGCDDAVVAGMVEGIISSHRYLQERGVLALFHALAEFGNLPEGRYTDARNKFTHKLCKLLRDRFQDKLVWESL